MYHIRFPWIMLGFAIALLFVLQPRLAYAQYEPPTHVTVTMYRLTEPDGGMLEPPILCNKDRDDIAISFGCTADPNQPYPFNDSTITISIEGTDGPDNDVYRYAYLKDVIAQEMSPSSFLQPALDAQAIAARTYAYWHIQASGGLNNSNQHHVFLPYRYQQFADVERNKIDSAVANRYYMSYHSSFINGFRTVSADEPIFSEFSSDAYQQSLTHVEQNPRHPYLRGVEDPVSFHPDIPPLIAATNAHQRGLSQNGAGRWARGSSSFRCDPAPAPCEPPPSVPHTAWSVRWADALQILTHYYTGIQIRDANAEYNPNTSQDERLITPNRRWVPLRIFGQESPEATRLLCKNNQGGFAVEVQNTGIFNWEAGAFELSYRTDWQSVTGQATTSASYLPPVLAGDSTTTLVTIPVPDDVAEGTYTIRLEMRKRTESGDYEWFSDDGWLGYPVNVMVVEDCSQVYLPLVQAEPSTVPSALFPD